VNYHGCQFGKEKSDDTAICQKGDAVMSTSDDIKEGLALFEAHYRARFRSVKSETEQTPGGDKYGYLLTSDLLRAGNYPRIFHHGNKTNDVIILTHGLSDSPYYLAAIGRRFFDEGVNVILPLLPAHGLKDPDKAMEDPALDSKWKAAVDNAVEVAGKLGLRISLGGFSTGGALSLNKILREPASIQGGLFLFSSALDLGLVDDVARIGFLQSIVRITDGKITGIGRDPYKYPVLPKFAGIELSQIINENWRLCKDRVISQPVFAAHSLHDTTVEIKGVLDFLQNHVKKGIAFIVSQQVSHSSLVLENDITLDDIPGAPEIEKPKANPGFRWMMDDAIRFFRENVVNN
jgi:pimeloyl-ACP methyl ester carboxylesterase